MCLSFYSIRIDTYGMAKKSDINHFGLRMEEELRKKIAAAAAANGRSMNAEIVHRLMQSFSSGVLSSYSDGELVKELIDRYCVILLVGWSATSLF